MNFFGKVFFGEETVVKIRMSEIKSIKKAYNAGIFDNSLKLTLHDDTSYFFTSFISRDDCFELIRIQLEARQAHLREEEKIDYLDVTEMSSEAEEEEQELEEEMMNEEEAEMTEAGMTAAENSDEEI